MKRFGILMLALAFMTGTVTSAFAQEDGKKQEGKKKKKRKKKKKQE